MDNCCANCCACYEEKNIGATTAQVLGIKSVHLEDNKKNFRNPQQTTISDTQLRSS